MTLRDSLRSILYQTRTIPALFGLRPNSVSIVIGAWNGTNTGRGAKATDLTPITEANGQPPKVRELNTEELALGDLGRGSLRIGPITPDFPGGGNSLDALKPRVDAGQTVHVLVTGPGYPDGALFMIKSLNTDRGLHWTLVVSPVQGSA